MRRPLYTARSLFASRLFAVGMLIAVGAWIFHVAAMSVAPLSLVQAVLAGGVVLLAVMAERLFGVRIGRRQWIGLGLTATGLMLLGVTVPGVNRGQSGFSASDMTAYDRAGHRGGWRDVTVPTWTSVGGDAGRFRGNAPVDLGAPTALWARPGWLAEPPERVSRPGLATL
jgi:hypothetical protein